MSVRPSLPVLAFATTLLAPAAAAQEQNSVAYPQRDMLTPYRQPAEVYAPPDELFRLLRVMQGLAASPSTKKSFDERGVEVVDDPAWRAARQDVQRLGIDGGNLAQIIRLNKNVADRATAFYAIFLVDNPDHVVNLIAHIPGEPDRRTREQALPRAVEYLKKNLKRRFGDLTPEQKKAAIEALPEPGSPAARAQGVKRAPVDADHLHDILLTPFFQALDLDDNLDQAQSLWFLHEVFVLRPDLALVWLEPSLPRLRQLLASPDAKVREQAISIFRVIGPEKQREAPVDDPRALQDWAAEMSKALFPPIRNLNDTIVQMQPSAERDALVEAGVKALETSAIGDPFVGETKDGKVLRGFRVARVPDELKPFAIPAEVVITRVNGVMVTDAATLLQTVRDQMRAMRYPRRFFVEYVRNDKTHAVEYRVL